MLAETFRSPVLKLVKFFRRSRDQWKDKCKQAKKELKSLKVCHAKLKASRDYWRHKARQATRLTTNSESAPAEPIKTPDPAAGLAGAARGNSAGPAQASGR